MVGAPLSPCVGQPPDQPDMLPWFGLGFQVLRVSQGVGGEELFSA